MSAFHDVLLPLAIASNATAGVERRVDVVALASGREARNTPWAHGRRRYDIGGAVRTLDDLHALIRFFEARRGKLHSFRFRDPFDHRSGGPSQAIGAMQQMLGVGDGARTAFQLVKVYGDGASAYVREITKPVANSVRVAINGVELTSSAFAADAATGMVTLSAPAPDSADVTAGFAFDTQVRFDMERLDLVMDGFGAGSALSVPLVEVLG